MICGFPGEFFGIMKKGMGKGIVDSKKIKQLIGKDKLPDMVYY